MQEAYEIFRERQFPSQNLKVKTEPTTSQFNLTSVQAPKRRSSETVVDRSKNIKLNQHPSISNAHIVQSKISSVSSPQSSNEALAELNRQNKMTNVISILNIPHADNNVLIDIFSKICQKLRIPVAFVADVSSIDSILPRTINVKFNDIKKKEEFLNRSRDKTLYTNDIIKNVPRDESTKIIFNTYLTRYYLNIRKRLERAYYHGKIYSFRLTKDGFAFKKTKISNDTIILSIAEFEENINSGN